MQPRTVKGPSWANEPQLLPHIPVGKAKGAVSEDDKMGVNLSRSQDALSDLEWMRQRMAKSTMEGHDTTIDHSGLPLTNESDTHQVGPHKVIPLRSASSNSIYISQSSEPLQVIRHETPFLGLLASLSGTSLIPVRLKI